MGNLYDRWTDAVIRSHHVEPRDDVTPEQRTNVELGTTAHLDDHGVLHVHVGEHDGPVRLVLDDEHSLAIDIWEPPLFPAIHLHNGDRRYRAAWE